MGEFKEAINDLQEVADTLESNFEETFQNRIDPLTPDTAAGKILYQLLVHE